MHLPLPRIIYSHNLMIILSCHFLVSLTNILYHITLLITLITLITLLSCLMAISLLLLSLLINCISSLLLAKHNVIYTYYLLRLMLLGLLIHLYKLLLPMPQRFPSVILFGGFHRIYRNITTTTS